MFKESQIEQSNAVIKPLEGGAENFSTLERAVSLAGQEINQLLERSEGLSHSKLKLRMSTFLVGLFLAFGVMGESAEAQDWRRKATRGVETVIVSAERQKSDQYLEEFKQQETIINLMEVELDKKFREESDVLYAKKDEAGLRKLEQAYAEEKAKLATARKKNLQDYKHKMEKQKMRHQAVDELRAIIH